MDRVEFITIQNGDDLILPFSFDEQAEFGVEGFIIHRCPKYEFALMPHERGPSTAWTEDDEIITVKIGTSQLSDEEIKAAIEILWRRSSTACRLKERPMCWSIKQLRGSTPPPTADEIEAAARLFVRRVSGYRQPSRANEAAFEQAVVEIAASTRRLLDSLVIRGSNR